MNKNAVKLISSNAINKIGNVIYDYGNSIWIASLGSLGQTFLGIYQMADTMTSIVTLPFGGALADRTSRKKLISRMYLVCAAICFLVPLLPSDQLLLYALVGTNIILGVATSLSSPAGKSFIKDIVAKDELVAYNSNREIVMQVISVSSPVLSFLVLHFASIRLALLVDAVTFLLAYLLIRSIEVDEQQAEPSLSKQKKSIFSEIAEGLTFMIREKEIFFLLILATFVNFFIAGYNYLLPFTDRLFVVEGSYATILSLGAVGAFLGAFLSKKMQNTMNNLLLLLFLCGLGMAGLSLSVFTQLPILLAYSGNLILEMFMAAFNIHFMSQVQTRVSSDYLGRVFSTIFTIAILFMPLATLLMPLFPASLNKLSFLFLGGAVSLFSLLAFLYQKRVFHHND